MASFEKAAETAAEALERFEIFCKPGISKEELMNMYDIYSGYYHHDATMPAITAGYNEPNYITDTLIEYLGDNKAAKIIDACAGTGLLGQKIRQLGYTNITALDGSAKMLEEAKKKNVYNDHICAWIGNTRLPIPDDTFDALCSSGAFTENHLRTNCLLEFIRIVKPGGAIVLGVSEFTLITVEALRDLEPTMKFYEDKGLWKMMLRKVAPTFWPIKGMETGVIFCFTPLEGKKIIGSH